MVSFDDFKKAFKRIGYLRFGKYADPIIARGGPQLDKLKKQMKQAGWEVSLRGYIGMAIFGSLLTFIMTFIGGLLFAFLMITISNEAILAILGFVGSIIIGIVLAGVIIWTAFWIPGSFIRERRIQIDNALPTVASYMSAMTSSGVPPAPVFASLAKEEINPIITQEATRINRDIEILGLDVLKALEQASFRSPSERWAGFLEGMIATVTSGGDLSTYLATETKSFMKYKQEETKEFIEELGVMAEIFMVLGVVAPLFFVVMVAITSILGGAAEGSVALLVGITYIVVPFLMIVMMILLDTTSTSVDV
ncbi:MAG: type II secretion system F family protein [Candidatus Hodarchaeales archaeon]